MQYFFVGKKLIAGELMVDDPALFHQLKNVLRFGVGDRFVILDGEGAKALAQISEIAKKNLRISVSDLHITGDSGRSVRLFVALSKKPSTFELIVQKATELGVTDIIPLVTEYCQTHELRKLDRLKLIIREAAEQSERIFLPTLHPLKKLMEVLKEKFSGKIFAGAPRNFDCKISEIKFSDGEDVNLFIGPEGGFSDEEEEMIKASGGHLFTIGKNILRMETAAIVALAIILLR